MEQLPEIIFIDGVLHTLYTTPLLSWLKQQDPIPVFDKRAPNCERGYVGRWKLEDNALWLTGLYAWRDGRHTGIAELFGENEAVSAEWFSGPLVVEPASSEIPDGALPKVTTLFIEAGKLDEPRASG